MFRSHEMSKINQELEQLDDTTYEFSGATLKINNDDDDDNNTMSASILRHRNNAAKFANDKNQSAILIGSDITSPIHSQLSTNPELSTNDCTGREEYPDERFNIGYPPDYKPELPSSTTNQQTANTARQCPREFFSFRSGQFDRAVNDCINILLRPTNDINILGSWLLTDVSHWDHERERVFILTERTFVTIKYDFIALKILYNFKVRLNQIDTVLRGKLTYPQISLVPRIEGITNGVASIICGSLFSRTKKPQKTASNIPQPPKSAVSKRFDFSTFHPIERKDLGIRILWNRGQPLPLISSWNPFSDDIPWSTIKDHPIYNSHDPNATQDARDEFNKLRHIYSVESLYNALIAVFSMSNPDSVNFDCCFEDGPILMQNYVGIGAVIHNKNNFGFFKCRGKFSF